MTLIAYKDGIMAADSGSWSGGRVHTCPYPKITRGQDGSLWALTGKMSDGWRLREWVLAGMSAEKPPQLVGADDDAASIFWVKPDGALWSARGGTWVFTPDAQTGAWGENDASNFCEGAMAAGLSAGQAVGLTIKNHLYAAGDVQIERLRQTLAEAAD